MTEQRPVSQIAKELAPCTPPLGYKKNWIVTMNDDGLPIFGKQIQIQSKHSTCTIILPMKKSSITSHTSRLSATVSWDEIMDFVTSNCNLSVRSGLAADTFNTSIDTIDMVSSAPPLLTAGDVAASSLVVLSSDSHYTFYTDGSLINLGSKDVSMGWNWIQIVKDSGFLNSIATYKRSIIHDWPSSSRAEAAAIYAALSASSANSVVHIYTDSQSSIKGLRHCFLFDYSDSRLYHKTTNFKLWAIIQKLIVDKNLSVLPFKVKAYSNFYWNDFADSLANTAHISEDAVLISRLNLAANSHSYDKGLWEHAMNITSKLKQSSRPK
ncbi:hypothetical protein RhiirC2_721513, partial [Rhizophagus irregularis]